ncbi:MAG: SDR family oxidoreductase [Actinomycetota bacterium]|nr:SDR family oxidoreductase [Actinomycetota bacterium]
MDLDLTGKKAVVTGASKGIGHAITAALRAEGAEVLAAARTGEFPVDLTTREGVAALAERAGDVDILVNNLGGILKTGGFLDLDDDTWQGTYELNLFSAVRVTRQLLPGLLRRRGVIVNISSIGAKAAYQPVDYGTAKAALTNLSKALAEEFGLRGLRVLTVTPGPTRTQNWADPEGYAGRLAAESGEPLAEFLAKAPARMGITTGRFTEPEETAALVAFLASPRAANLTAADYLADGGAIKTV